MKVYPINTTLQVDLIWCDGTFKPLYHLNLNFDADPDLHFDFDANPDPAFFFDADQIQSRLLKMMPIQIHLSIFATLVDGEYFNSTMY
jgi:hypothetical protein